MKKNVLYTTLGTWALLIVLFATGCTPPPQNANSNQNQNANKATNTGPANSVATESDDGTCSIVNIAQRRQDVYNKIKEKVEHSTLNDQYQAKTFKFDVVIPAGVGVDTLNLLIEGRIGGPTQFGVLEGIIKNFVKAKCTSKVIFVKPGTLPLKEGALPGDYTGFEWTACDYPNEPCPGGECRPPGTCPNPLPSTNGNTNSKP